VDALGGGSKVSLLWKVLCSVQEGVGEFQGGWFERSVRHKIGNGESSSFWNNPLLDEGPLRLRFNGLFNIHVDKNIFVAKTLRLG